mmetsp:Transcript_4087/g.16386  ORF Transcript_4087/g.16386 Transcript_4087/m.16386 type:complete len:255 (+) Transcript_4087:844-1608(+)
MLKSKVRRGHAVRPHVRHNRGLPRMHERRERGPQRRELSHVPRCHHVGRADAVVPNHVLILLRLSPHGRLAPLARVLSPEFFAYAHVLGETSDAVSLPDGLARHGDGAVFTPVLQGGGALECLNLRERLHEHLVGIEHHQDDVVLDGWIGVLQPVREAVRPILLRVRVAQLWCEDGGEPIARLVDDEHALLGGLVWAVRHDARKVSALAHQARAPDERHALPMLERSTVRREHKVQLGRDDRAVLLGGGGPRQT